MDDMYLQLLVDLHRCNLRQGPGGEVETRKALSLAGLDRSCSLKVADVGCGTGGATLLLARELDAEITAVDFLPEFLEILQARAQEQGVAEKIIPLNCSMDTLPFLDEDFDVIWSEGAIYNMGFEAGISAWHRFLKPGGKLVVSEITWLTAERPDALQAHWDTEYPEIDVASAKMALLEQHGYCPEAYFFLPKQCWLENYYRPIHNGIEAFLERNAQSEAAREIVESEKAELVLYEKYCDYFGYGVYIASKI